MTGFVKAHGTGNDFVVFGDLDNALEISATQVRAICDRHFGIGADGLIRIGTNGEGFFMDHRNADGTMPEMCGNGVRVVGKWLGDRGHCQDEVAVHTRSGVKHLLLHRDEMFGFVQSVTVDMGAPVGEVEDVAVEVDGSTVEAHSVSMGNPHAVVFVDDIDSVDVPHVGAAIEHHKLFGEGTNVEFVDQRDGRLRQRTWERGVGETLSCGTGACAVAVAAHTKGLTGCLLYTSPSPRDS